MKLTKKQAFTLVETFIFITTLSIILAASVPLIAKKHKQQPKIVTHGTYVCYKNADNKYVQERYDSRRMVSSMQVSSCTFNPNPNVPVYKVSLIPPGGGGVEWFSPSDTTHRGKEQDSKSRRFTVGSGYSTNWSSTIAGNVLDAGRSGRHQSFDLSDNDLASAFSSGIYSRCADLTSSGNSCRYNIQWADPKSENEIRCYLADDEKQCEKSVKCSKFFLSFLAGGACEDMMDGVRSKYDGVPIENKALKSETPAWGGQGLGKSNARFCVNNNISRNSSDVDAWKYYSEKYYSQKYSEGTASYEQFLKDFGGRYTVKNGSNGSHCNSANDFDYGSAKEPWAYIVKMGYRAASGESNSASTITDNWKNKVYKNAVFSGGQSCKISRYGDCTPIDGLQTENPVYQDNVNGEADTAGRWGISDNNIPQTTQTVTYDRRWVQAGTRGKVATPLSFETFELRGTCDIVVHDTLKAQTRGTNSTRTGTGASLVCRDGNKTVFSSSVDLPDNRKGDDRFETLFRGGWNQMSRITASSYTYMADDSYDAGTDLREKEGLIEQTAGAQTVLSKKDGGRAPFDKFGKAGEGQQITEACGPEIWFSWTNQSGTTEERQVHGTSDPCDNTGVWYVSKNAEGGGPGAVIISW